MAYFLQYNKEGTPIGYSTVPLICEEIISKEVSEEELKLFIQNKNANLELQELRNKREAECFSIINRGALWYNTLTEEQFVELQKWYEQWLNVTLTRWIPEKPSWIK